MVIAVEKKKTNPKIRRRLCKVECKEKVPSVKEALCYFMY